MTAGLNTIILGTLALMWIAVLAWEFLGNVRDGRRRRDPMGSFLRQLSLIGKMVPDKVVHPANRFGDNRVGSNDPWIPGSTDAAAERRRAVFLALAAAAAVAGIAWYFTASHASGIALAVSGSLLIGFASLAMRRRQEVVQRANKVSYLPSAGRVDLEPARRRAN